MPSGGITSAKSLASPPCFPSPPPHWARWALGPAPGELAGTHGAASLRTRSVGWWRTESVRSPSQPLHQAPGKGISAHFLWGLPGSFNARPSRVELGWYWESDEAGSGVAGPASEPSAFDKRVQTPVNFTQTAFDRSLVIFGELSHKFVPSCCRNLLSGVGGRGRKGRQAGRSSTEDGHGGWLRPGLEGGG